MNDRLVYVSQLAPYFEKYLEMRHSLGIKEESTAMHLRNLDKFCKNYLDTPLVLSQKLVQAWIEQRPTEKVISQQIRIRLIRKFAKFLVEQGKEAYILPPSKSVYQNDFKPYIFTHSEINRIFTVIDNMNCYIPSPNSYLVYPVLFRILYGCGLRISEALNLRIQDIDFKNGIITVKKGKFDKDRYVPLTDNLLSICKNYVNKVRFGAQSVDFLFPSPRLDDRSIHKHSAYSMFRKILWESGIPHQGKSKGPRLHDFRHTFAVHSLQKWINTGVDVQCVLPILSTYLGHKNIYATQWYLRLTAEAYPEMLEQIENTCNKIFPEVNEL